MVQKQAKQPQFIIAAGILVGIGVALSAGIVLGRRSASDQPPLPVEQRENETTTTATPPPPTWQPPPAATTFSPPPSEPPRLEERRKNGPGVSRPPTITNRQLGPIIPDAEQLERLEKRLTALTKSANNASRQRLLRELGKELASGITPDQLQYWLEKLSDQRGRQLFARGFIEGLAEIDPKSAADQATELAEGLADVHGYDLAQITSTIMMTWSATAPADAAKWSAQLTPGSREANAAWHAIAQKWAISDPDSALQWSTDLGSTGASVTTRIAQILGQKNAEDAVQRLFEMDAGPSKDAYLAGITTAWVRLDPATALDAVATITDRGRRTTATHQAVVHWAHLDPAAAAEWATNNADQSLKSGLQQNIARTWSSKDPIAALAWAAEQEDLTLREALISAAAPQAIWRDPDLAIKTVASLPYGQHRTNAVNRLVSNWAQRDPAKAAEFAATAELTAKMRHTAVADASYQWARRSANETTAWLENLPEENNRWNAVMGAISGASKFTDGQIVSQWWTAMRKESIDADTVRTWLQRPEVSESVRDQFMPLVK